MKRVQLLVIILCIFISNLFGQTYDFSKTLGNTGADYGSIKIAPNGDIYKIGTFSGTVSLSPSITLTATGTENYLVKYSACGNYISHITNIPTNNQDLNSILPGYSWCLDPSGSVYMVQQTPFLSNTPADITVTKYSPLLSLLWQVHLPQMPSRTMHLRIIFSKEANGGVILSGHFDGKVTGNFMPVPMNQSTPSSSINTSFNTATWNGMSSVFILKIDGNGNYQNHNFLGKSPQTIHTQENSISSSIVSFMQGSQAFVYQAGWFIGALNFFNPPLNSCASGPNCQNQALFICKYSNSSSSLWGTSWRYKVNLPYSFYGNFSYPKIAETNGNCVYASTIHGNYWPSDITNANSSLLTVQQKDIVVSSISDAGVYMWTKQIGSSGNDQLVDLKTDGNGNVYILGKFSNTVTFDPGTTLTATPQNETFLLKLDQSGNFIWVKQLSIDGGYYECHINATGSNIFLDGSFQNSSDFNPDPLVSDIKTSAGNFDHVFVKLSNTHCPPPCNLTLTETHTSPICINNNGSINLTVSNGTAPYIYNWSNGATTEDITGLNEDTYTVTVTDANGCTATKTIALTLSPAPVLTDTRTNATCGINNGSINLTVSYGTAPFTYSWSNGATTEDLSNLAAGTYTVNVTDAKGCTAARTVTIAGYPALTLTESHGDAGCSQNNGYMKAVVTTGTAPYSYNWSTPNGNGWAANNLAPGTYTVTVTDSKGCTATVSATIGSAPCTTCCTGGQWKSKYIGWSIMKDKAEMLPSVAAELKQMNIPENEMEAEPVKNEQMPSSTPKSNQQKIILPGGGVPTGPIPDRIDVACKNTYHLNQNGKYTLNADYQCGTVAGSNCTKQIKVTIQGPPGCTFNGTYDAPYTQTFTQDGNYSITYRPICGDVACPPCTFNLIIDKNCCLNSKWITAKYQTVTKIGNLTATTMPASLPLTITAPIPTYTANQSVNISGLNFQCAAGCAAGYKVIQRNTVTGQQITTLLPAGTTAFNIQPLSTKQVVRIFPMCGTQQCGPMLLFNVACSDNTCPATSGGMASAQLTETKSGNQP